MRELTLEELELISGGSITTNGPDIVVTGGDGGGDGGGDWGDWGDWGDYPGGDGGDGGGGGDGTPPPDPPPPDCQAQDVNTSNLPQPPNASQQQAIDAIKSAVATVIGAAASKPGDTTIAQGSSDFTVREFFELVSKADYIVNQAGTDYSNDPSPSVQGGGAADRNNGDPIISVNMDTLLDRGLQSPESAIFYVLHELVHTTSDFWDSRPAANATSEQKVGYEQATNAAALALAQALGIPMHGYQPPLGVGDKTATTQAGSGPTAGATPICG